MCEDYQSLPDPQAMVPEHVLFRERSTSGIK
jgi:hypothetical protein